MEKEIFVVSRIFMLSSFLTWGVVILMLILIIIFILIACKFKPWRRFLSSSSSAARHQRTSIKVDDIERPLVSGDPDIVVSHDCESIADYYNEEDGYQKQDGFSLPSSTKVEQPKQKIPSTSPHLAHNDSFILDIPNSTEDSFVGQTLKRPVVENKFSEERIYGQREDTCYASKYNSQRNTFKDFVPNYSAAQRSIITFEVTSGPSQGLRYSVQSTDASKLPITIGRVLPGDILLKDSEVSGKHAMINWNSNELKWQLTDMGSLNGTLLNAQAIHRPQTGNRQWGSPFELSSGDIITFGTSSKICVQITTRTDCQIPFGIGIASDPMAVRQGGKKLPMEDVCYYQWPLPGVDQFGIFGICDGHGGSDVATSVSKIMPEVMSGILSDLFRREKILSQFDASDVLREAFYQTESRITNYYEGCTATVLLVWTDEHENFYAQCANVGDSAGLINIEGKLIRMTEDHRISSYSERLRMQASGAPLRDGETRICGINLARMMGDKFLKEQDDRFSSEPFISEVVFIHRESKGFALLASDGFWDVVNTKKAIQLIHRGSERISAESEYFAEKMANFLLSEARTLRTKDNTSILFLDFNTRNCKAHP